MASRIDVVLESGLTRPGQLGLGSCRPESTQPGQLGLCYLILLAHVVSLFNCMEIDR